MIENILIIVIIIYFLNSFASAKVIKKLKTKVDELTKENVLSKQKEVLYQERVECNVKYCSHRKDKHCKSSLIVLEDLDYDGLNCMNFNPIKE